MLSKSIFFRSAPHFGIGLLKKCARAFSLKASIHAGSFFKAEIFLTTSSDNPFGISNSYSTSSFSPYLFGFKSKKDVSVCIMLAPPRNQNPHGFGMAKSFCRFCHSPATLLQQQVPARRSGQSCRQPKRGQNSAVRVTVFCCNVLPAKLLCLLLPLFLFLQQRISGRPHPCLNPARQVLRTSGSKQATAKFLNAFFIRRRSRCLGRVSVFHQINQIHLLFLS